MRKIGTDFMWKENVNDLERFLIAQADTALEIFMELANCKKQSCWMWFVFPQLRGLSKSEVGEYYGLQDINEAERLLRHPLLGMRLRMFTWLVYDAPADMSLLEIFGSELDVQKFKTCMELFIPLEKAPTNIFQLAYDRYFTTGPRYVEWLPFFIQDWWHRWNG